MSEKTCTSMINTRDIVTKNFFISANNAIKELQHCLAEIRKPWRYSTAKSFELTLCDIYFTPPVLALLVQVLNQPLPKAPSDIESKWDDVDFYYCRFESDETSSSGSLADSDIGGYCSPDEMRLLGATLACRTSALFLKSSWEILEYLYSAPKLEIEKLYLSPGYVSTSACEGLGDLVQRCAPLKLLCLYFSMVEEPQILVESIDNAIHLQELWIMSFLRGRRASTTLSQAAQDIVLRLLQNSQNQLQKLYVEDMGLGECCFRAIVDLLPTSGLEVLSLRGNDIEAQGILAFANQLSRIKSLKEIVLADNPWEHSSVPAQYDECIAALLQGMRANDSIECLGTCRLEKELDYCTHANWVRRRLLAPANPIPVGLWPLILEQVGTRKWHPTWDEKLRPEEYRANSVFFVLQNTSLLSSIDSLCFLRRSPRKRKSVDRYF